MLSDMALEEGSGGYSDDNLNDDEDYMEGSGDDGSGDGECIFLSFFVFSLYFFDKNAVFKFFQKS